MDTSQAKDQEHCTMLNVCKAIFIGATSLVTLWVHGNLASRVCNLNPKIGLTRTGLGFFGFFRVKALKIISISGRVGFKLYKKVWVISTRVIERKKPLGFFGFFRVEKLKTQFIFCHNLLFLTQ